MRSRKHKNYGSVPRNEYTMMDAAKSADSTATLANQPPADGSELDKPLQKRQLRYLFGKSRIRGWLRSRSTNSWRAESASQQDQAAEEEFIDNVWKD